MANVFSTFSIGRPTRRCAVTGRELSLGEPCIAVLMEGDRPEQPVRLDYSIEAWQGGQRPPAEASRVIAFWRTSVHDPRQKAKPLLDDESLADLFEQTGAEGPTDGARAALRFVVTLLMIRRRLLVQDASRGRMLMVRHRGTPRPPEGPPLIEVLDPDLDENAVMEILAQLDGSSGEEAADAAEAPGAGAGS